MYNPKDSVCPEGGMDTPDIYIISQANTLQVSIQ
jgi:hypothetical protein